MKLAAEKARPNGAAILSDDIRKIPLFLLKNVFFPWAYDPVLRTLTHLCNAQERKDQIDRKVNLQWFPWRQTATTSIFDPIFQELTVKSTEIDPFTKKSIFSYLLDNICGSGDRRCGFLGTGRQRWIGRNGVR